VIGKKSLLWLLIVCSGFFSNFVFAQSVNASYKYTLHCSGCHGTDGQGSRAGGIPSLSLVKTFTGDNEGRKYLLQVPGVSYSGLSNRDIALVMNYVIDRWGRRESHLKSSQLLRWIS